MRSEHKVNRIASTCKGYRTNLNLKANCGIRSNALSEHQMALHANHQLDSARADRGCTSRGPFVLDDPTCAEITNLRSEIAVRIL